MKIGFVMEPIPAKNLKKDSTLLLMLEAQNNGHDIYFIDSILDLDQLPKIWQLLHVL